MSTRHHSQLEDHDVESHHHQWIWVDATDDQDVGHFACQHCSQTTAPCSDCDRPVGSSSTICARCLQRARQLIDDCEAAYNAIPENPRMILALRAIRYDASPGGSASSDASLPFGIGADEDVVEELAAVVPRSENGTVIHLMREPENVMTVLHEWADDWADRSGMPWESHRVSVFRYLRELTLWAAQNHPAWHRYLEEARGVRSKLRAIAGTSPVAEPAPCPQCGGRVVREWGKRGLDDQRRCTRCRHAWSDGEEFIETGRRVLLAMPTTNPDLLVTREQGRRLVPDLSANLLRQVIFRDRRRNDPTSRAYDPTWMPRLPVQWFDGTEELYRLGDVMCVRWSPRTDTPSTSTRQHGLSSGLLP